MNEINITAILIANGLGILTCIMLLINNLWCVTTTQTERRCLTIMIYTALITCFTESLVFYYDGNTSILARIILYVRNTWSYTSNIILGPSWLILIAKHIRGTVDKLQRIIIYTLCSIGAVTLIVNFFYPLVFTIDNNNVYQRGSLFWLYVVIESLFIFDGFITYIQAKIHGGILKFFPVWQFLIPVSFGVVIQSTFYGISTIWPCVSISFIGITTSLQSETVYRDKLTGLYNRFYLNAIKLKSIRKKSSPITAMMLDMNGFKSINDHYGHEEGDKALIIVADVLQTVVGDIGTVIRYAGDEFIILLNTQQPSVIEEVTSTIHEKFEIYNQQEGLPYKLSVSIGTSIFNLQMQTIDELINEIDQKMYEEKELYYQSFNVTR